MNRNLILIIFFLGIVLMTKAQSLTNFSTNLPLVIIDTEGRTIVDEPKITATMKIISNTDKVNRPTDTANEYDGFIGIELRGSSSQNYPQKPYAIETREADGSNNNVSILGMPKENDWVLLSNYNDKSLMRNILGYQLFAALGHYAPRSRLVDVIVNNQYQGIYLLAEKIKRDKNRVNIAKLKEEDTEGEELTGGYIFKVDYWTNNNSWQSPHSPINHPDFDVHFIYYDPKPDELVPRQKDYLEDFVTAFEDNLYSADFSSHSNGYSKYIDVESFIDYFIVSEISRNNDGFKKSRYFHKDKNGKIAAGPVWDFDWAWKNINECYIFQAMDGSGWSYKVNNCNPWVKSPEWMTRLFYDSAFKNKTNCRYFETRDTKITDAYIFGLVDSVYNLVEEAQVKHFERWDILGKNVGAPEIDAQPKTYAGEVDKLKKWITKRLNWLDQNMIGECIATGNQEIVAEQEIILWPNPASDHINLRAPLPIEDIQIFSATGVLLQHEIVNEHYTQLNVQHLKQGYYLAKIKLENGHTLVRKFLKR